MIHHTKRKGGAGWLFPRFIITCFSLFSRHASLAFTYLERPLGHSNAGYHHQGGPTPFRPPLIYTSFAPSNSREYKWRQTTTELHGSFGFVPDIFFDKDRGGIVWTRVLDFIRTTALGQSAASSSLSDSVRTDDEILSQLFQRLMDNTKLTESTMEVVTSQDPITAISSVSTLFYSLPGLFQAVLILAPVLLSIVAFLYKESSPPNGFRSGYEPYARGQYNAYVAKEYYSRHPQLVLRRMLQLFRISNKFLFNFLVDKYVFRDEEKQRPKRAKEVLALIQRAGPTAIKVRIRRVHLHCIEYISNNLVDSDSDHRFLSIVTLY